MRIVLAGNIGRLPVGGHAWVEMQYLLGLRACGHDVLYVEDCGEQSWVYNWRTQELTNDLEYPTDYLRDCLTSIGFGERWCYRAGEESRGCDLAAVRSFCHDADLLIIRAVPLSVWRPEYEAIPFRIFIDADPLFTQIQLLRGRRDLCETVDRCHELFTVGRRIGEPDCTVPATGRTWHKTVPPVHLPEWPCDGLPPATHFTSVLQWQSYADVEYDGVRYGNKRVEFPRFLDVPRSTGAPFQLALTGGNAAALQEHGWDIVEGWRVSETPEAYRCFIQHSRAEFGVAKHGYVTSRCGWFSDRSVCYLASGRPVVVQDTGLGDWLPIGAGVLTFSDAQQACDAVQRVQEDYGRQQRAARAVAEELFDARKVLPDLLERAVN